MSDKKYKVIVSDRAKRMLEHIFVLWHKLIKMLPKRKSKSLWKQCVLWNVCRSVFHFLKKRIYRRINIIRCLLQSGISFFTKSKMIRFMWIISLTAVKITVGLSVKTEYQIHKSSLHSRWRFFCTQKGGAMIGSQDK